LLGRKRSSKARLKSFFNSSPPLEVEGDDEEDDGNAISPVRGDDAVTLPTDTLHVPPSEEQATSSSAKFKAFFMSAGTSVGAVDDALTLLFDQTLLL